MEKSVIITGLPTKDYYQKVLEHKVSAIDEETGKPIMKYFIDREHVPVFKKMMTDYDQYYPSTILSQLGYLTEEDYIKIVGPSLTSKPSLLTTDDQIEQLVSSDAKDLIRLFRLDDHRERIERLNYSNTKLEDMLEQLYSNGIYPLGILRKTEQSGTFFFLCCEPQNTRKDDKTDHRVIFGPESPVAQIINDLSKQIACAANYNTLVVTRKTFDKWVGKIVNINSLKFLVKTSNVGIEQLIIDRAIADALKLKATDIYIDQDLEERDGHIVSGVRVSVSILGDYIRGKLIEVTGDQLSVMNAYMYKLAMRDVGEQYGRKVRYLRIPDLGRLGLYSGRLCASPGARSDELDSCVIRVLKNDMSVWAWDKLPIHEDKKIIIQEAINSNKAGIILMGGKTGSGKSTTVRSFLMELINKWKPFASVEAVESPIEVIMPGIAQLEIDTSEGSEFNAKDVTEALTRRARDVVYLSEINSGTLLRACINLAQENHLLISTLHTESVSEFPNRCIGMLAEQSKDDRFAYRQFLQAARLLLYQIMLKQVCPQEECQKKVYIDDGEITSEQREVLTELYKWPEDRKITLSRPRKMCPICHGRGVLVDKPIICVEALGINQKLRSILMKTEDPIDAERVLRKKLLELKQTGVEDALEYMKEGKLDFDQIWREFSMINQYNFWLEGDNAGNTD